MTDGQKIEAALARIRGEYDNPALMAFGPLSTSEFDDVEAILSGDDSRYAEALIVEPEELSPEAQAEEEAREALHTWEVSKMGPDA